MIRMKLMRSWILAGLLVLLVLGCTNTDAVQGRYQAEVTEGPSSISIRLELGANGQGDWALKGEKVFFKWETQGKEVWLHTKSGGVVVGQILGPGTIEVNMPGAGIISFKKTGR
jgi:hypothetical protein